MVKWSLQTLKCGTVSPFTKNCWLRQEKKCTCDWDKERLHCRNLTNVPKPVTRQKYSSYFSKASCELIKWLCKGVRDSHDPAGLFIYFLKNNNNSQIVLFSLSSTDLGADVSETQIRETKRKNVGAMSSLNVWNSPAFTQTMLKPLS